MKTLGMILCVLVMASGCASAGGRNVMASLANQWSDQPTYQAPRSRPQECTVTPIQSGWGGQTYYQTSCR